mmetsp:Transcript_99250/g.167325  ORF Transcript_99250/g.167325 Transcript_99250/m.167325 type:complete len:115 (+) Transcript_99250:236-580(+)
MLQNHQSHVHVGAAEAPSTLIHSFLTLSQRSESIRVALPGVQKVASVGIGGTNPIPRSELAKPVKGGNTATNKPHSRCVCVCVCVCRAETYNVLCPHQVPLLHAGCTLELLNTV